MNNVISTKVSIFRNVKNYKFQHKLTPEIKQEIVDALEKVLKNKMSLININTVDINVIKFIKDNGLQVGNCQNIFLDKKEKLAINLFGGEHLTIVSTEEGFNKKAIDSALELVQMLSNKISFSFSDEYGYLMCDLAKIGTGIKLESNIMLSAIKSINKIEQVKQNLLKLGYSLNETKYPAIYTLSTNCNLGISEKKLYEEYEKTLSKLQDLEIESIKMLDVSKHDEILDKTQRSWALLNSAHLLDYDELYNMIVNLRFGINLQLIDVDPVKINQLQKLVLNKKTDYVAQSELKELAEKVKQILKGE